MTIQTTVKTTASGLGAITLAAVCVATISAVFYGIPTHFFGKPAGAVGISVFTLLVWSYILGLYSNL